MHSGLSLQPNHLSKKELHEIPVMCREHHISGLDCKVGLWSNVWREWTRKELNLHSLSVEPRGLSVDLRARYKSGYSRRTMSCGNAFIGFYVLAAHGRQSRAALSLLPSRSFACHLSWNSRGSVSVSPTRGFPLSNILTNLSQESDTFISIVTLLKCSLNSGIPISPVKC